MDPSLVVSFPEGVSLASNGNGQPVLDVPGGRRVLHSAPHALRAILGRLVYPGSLVEALASEVHLAGQPGGVAQLVHYLDQLTTAGLLIVSADAEGRRWATLAPTAPTFIFRRKSLGTSAYVLSRFTYLRRFGDVAVLESPLAAAQVVLHQPAVGQLVCALARPTTVAQLDAAAPDLPSTAATQVMRLLLAAGMLTEFTERETTAEDEQPSLAPWEFHDLLFHARSREGRNEGVLGTMYSFGRRRDPPPIVKPFEYDKVIVLPRPDPVALEQSDPPLAQVVERRRSIRRYAAEPIGVDQLGEFLHRVARVRDVFPVEAETPWGRLEMEATSRPYPASGGLFPLEFYVVARACRGLEPGVFHYDPMGHRLGRLCGATADVARLLDESAAAIAEPPEEMQVLLVLTARFDRVMWKYSGFAYSLILKDVGIVFQNLYLAATAMNLAPCAIGVGNSDRFSRILGADYYAETSVGEFALGSAPSASEISESPSP